MKLKAGIKIAAGWRSRRVLFDILETMWMTFMPLFCGAMFGLSENLWWLGFGILPIFFKFIYKRETEDTVIYLR
jgi:hypothetical protein